MGEKRRSKYDRWIMVVDEQPVNLFFTNKLLLKMGYRNVYACDSGKMALQIHSKYPCDLILTSCQMQGTDGFALSRAVRLEETGTKDHTPIIAMTSDTLDTVQKECLAAGMDDCINKPLTADSLRLLFKKWLRPNAWKKRSTEISTLKSEYSPSIMSLPLDMKYLDDFVGDNADEKRVMINMFQKGVDEALSLMYLTLVNNDDKLWKKTAHKLKGTTANFGAEPLHVLFAQAEDMSFGPVIDKKEVLQMMNLANDDLTRFLSL